jgi:hypothetical protein
MKPMGHSRQVEAASFKEARACKSCLGLAGFSDSLMVARRECSDASHAAKKEPAEAGS